MKLDKIWPRAIILIDMNAFFSSVEQLDRPEWRGQPVAVTNGSQGTTIITCSYEARQFGIKTGMKIYEAKRICAHLIHAPSRPHRYAEVSKTIMEALTSITPDCEIASCDECYLDVTHCQQLYDPIKAAQKSKSLIYKVSGLHCSVGVSGDKTTAKFAAQLQKPNGFTVIYPDRAKERLRHVPVTELCGIGQGVGKFLARYGIYTCGDMENLPIGILAKRFGNLGKRFWYMCQGADPEPVHVTIPSAKSMGHGKVLPPGTVDDKQLLYYFSYLCERLAARLRENQMKASVFFIGMNSTLWGWIGKNIKTPYVTNHGVDIFVYCEALIKSHLQHGEVRQVQVTALNPSIGQEQLDLFIQEDEKAKLADAVKDKINTRFGEATLKPARHLQRQISDMTPVIAPAWRPSGSRHSVKGET